ncbi:hypothetical protein [Agromyces sp. CCNWLW203]|uniref:hypothetical protein n=1 Tax=Agromyces sp. CCNWLW203 TaxID=3112842 RepID=UPI002F966E61
MIDFTSLQLFGAPLEHVETYIYYDGPKALALRSSIYPLVYLINTVEEDEYTGETITLAVAMTEQRFLAVRSGTISFRDAFTGAPLGSLLRIDWSYDEGIGEAEDSGPAAVATLTNIAVLDAREIPAYWLPAREARLNLPTETVTPYSDRNLVDLSAAQDRTVFAVEVASSRSNITSLPAKTSGQFQVALAGEFEALAREVASGSVAKELFASVLDLQAASFVMVFAVETHSWIQEPVDVTDVLFERLLDMVEAVASGDEATFLAAMRKHDRRARARFLDMLKPLAAVDSGLTITTALAFRGSTTRASASADHVRGAVDAIEAVLPEEHPVSVTRGILTGLVLRTQRFELVDLATGDTYKGSMTDTATEEANGLTVGDTSFVSASINAVIPFAEEDAGKGIRYVLEHIAPHN